MNADDIELTPDPMLGPGIWADAARVYAKMEAVTIDFAVIDPVEPNQGRIIARVTLTPSAAFALRDVLIKEMQSYTDPDL